MSLLEKKHTPEAVKSLSSKEKIELAAEVRKKIVDTVSKTGGHLAPSLGVVDLTIALLSVFDPLKDKIIWDVGHQAYAWKILTDRYDNFHTLRQKDGVAPFPKPSESPYDHFIAGHASISISAAIGKAHARDLRKDNSHVVAIIGDGALTGGIAYEALNQAGELKKQIIVILNDNNMSISPNVGSFSRFISGNLSNSLSIRIKRWIRDFLYSKPSMGKGMLKFLKKGEQSFKAFTTPGSLFEAFDFNYIGPVDGNNIEQVIRHIEIAKSALKLNQPVLLHLKTLKGKGYQPAEFDPSSFHSTGGFEPETGLVSSPKSSTRTNYLSPTDAFSHAICKLAENNNKITAITAAMIAGTGLHKFKEKYPNRCIDVGICEQHATTFAAGLASEGFSPIVAIYSTFIQRAYDQIIHDICIPNLPVVFCLDRAGLVGEDGATHHGMFDLSFLRSVPNMHIIVPSSPEDILDCLATAIALKAPVALRYPRGKVAKECILPESYNIIPLGEGEFLYPNSTETTKDLDLSLLYTREENACIITIGTAKNIAIEASKTYFETKKKTIPVFNARFVKPLPKAQLREIAEHFSHIIIVEENTEVGGFSSAILEYYNDTHLIQNIKIDRLALPDIFIEHGTRQELHDMYNLNAKGILDLLD